MQKYFNILFEFDRNIFDSIVENAIKSEIKGYVCVVDGNVLAHATKDTSYRNIINGAIVNSCDGSSIALLAGRIHMQKLSTYTGPEIFEMYVKKNHKQYFLGNTTENLQRLKSRFSALNYNSNNFKFESLPFKSIEDFDYNSIADDINEFKPDIIWVSLGAPKQEIFISKLYPLINSGVLFAIGAAFNLFLVEKSSSRISIFSRKMHLLWLFRIYQEPQKQFSKVKLYLSYLPKIVIAEIKTKNKKHNIVQD